MTDDATTTTTDDSTDQQSATDTDQTDTTSTDTAGDKDWKAEAEKWKELSRKNEHDKKANAGAAKELEELKKKGMSDTEKAVAEAKAEGRKEALLESGSLMVEAEIKAAAAGRNVDVAALLEGIDRSRFLNDDGKPDTDAITAWVDKIAPSKSDEKKPFPDLGQGDKGTKTDTKVAQLRAAAGLPPK
jgi:hypothetical protein